MRYYAQNKIMKDDNIYTTAELADSVDLTYNKAGNFLARLRKGGVQFHPHHSGGSGDKGNAGTWQLLL